ncbi:MAG: xanthine dehydrogenase family protein subunit M [Velocimicrobium sp.]
MTANDYIHATSVSEAIDYYKRGDCILISGGTCALVKGMDRKLDLKKAWLDIYEIEELKQMEETDEYISIGACVTLTNLLKSEYIETKIPLLWEAISQVGNRQIRNRATLGGNIANACPASDCISALMVLGAQVLVQGEQGSRAIPIAKLFRKCNACLRHAGMHVRSCFFSETTKRKLMLNEDEIIRSIEIPKQNPNYSYLFYKLTQNRSSDLAIVNMAMTGEKNKEGIITQLNICMGGLFPKPICFDAWKDCLIGKEPKEEYFAQVAMQVAYAVDEEKDSLADYDYKRKIVPDLIIDGLKELFLGYLMDGEKPRAGGEHESCKSRMAGMRV